MGEQPAAEPEAKKEEEVVPPSKNDTASGDLFKKEATSLKTNPSIGGSTTQSFTSEPASQSFSQEPSVPLQGFGVPPQPATPV